MKRGSASSHLNQSKREQTERIDAAVDITIRVVVKKDKKMRERENFAFFQADVK